MTGETNLEGSGPVSTGSVAATGDQALTPASPGTALNPKRHRARGIGRAHVLAVACAIAGLAWGSWTTRAVLDLRASPTRIAKVRLQSLVGDYVRAQARSATPPDQIGPATARFMTMLDAAIARHARAGEVVLVSEAVVGGDVRDVTDQIRREVYAQVPVPRAAEGVPDSAQDRASGGDVEARMRDYLLHAGAANGTGH